MQSMKFRVFIGGHLIVVDSSSSYTLTFGSDKPILSMFSNGGEFVCDQEVEEVDQFTGLTDCNGVEIYEGDVIRDHVGIGVVRYSEKHAAFRVCYGYGLAKWFYDYTLKGEIESIEVLGNQHQNLELELLK